MMKTKYLSETPLELKFTSGESEFSIVSGSRVEGYASLFKKRDQGGDMVAPGAYQASLKKLMENGRRVRMLWQHDPREPIGVWDEINEDDRGLYVRGRLLPEVSRAREAAALLEAGAIDGLSIGYRTLKSHRDGRGGRVLSEVELWEVSVVTFPMLPEARVDGKDQSFHPDGVHLHQAVVQARKRLRSELSGRI
jgi:HK97 family phage prohead protease